MTDKIDNVKGTKRKTKKMLSEFHFINTYFTLCIVYLLNTSVFNSTERYRETVYHASAEAES